MVLPVIITMININPYQYPSLSKPIPNNKQISAGDVIFAVNGETDPRRFRDVLKSNIEVEIVLQRKIDVERQPFEDKSKAIYVKSPFEAIIIREDINEKWGLVMDMTTGSVFDIVRSIMNTLFFLLI